MALAARALAYDEPGVHYTGPVAANFTFQAGGRMLGGCPFSQLEIGFAGAKPPLGFRTIAQTTNDTQGIELLIGGRWVSAEAEATGSSVVVSFPCATMHKISPVHLQECECPAAVRYAWKPIPDSQLLYDSAPGHGLSGLPAPPFW